MVLPGEIGVESYIMQLESTIGKLTIKYGLSRGIPLEQLDFFHCKFEDETY